MEYFLENWREDIEQHGVIYGLCEAIKSRFHFNFLELLKNAVLNLCCFFNYFLKLLVISMCKKIAVKLYHFI